MHIAVQEGKSDVVSLLLKYGADPNAKTVHGRTPLHIACVLGDYISGKMLISTGCDYNAQDYELNTPMHYASAYSKRLIRLRTCRAHKIAENDAGAEAGPHTHQ